MVLGLIDFLLGGKKKTKVPRTGQVVSPVAGGAGGTATDMNVAATVPNGQNNPTGNASGNLAGNANQDMESEGSEDLNFKDSSTSSATSGSMTFNQSGGMGGGQKKSISVVIGKIHEELKSTNTKITELVSDIKSLENTVNGLGHRIDDLEESKKGQDEKMSEIDSNMGKFLSLYELINNQYNPFVEDDGKIKLAEGATIGEDGVKKIILGADGNSLGEEGETSSKNFDSMRLKESDLKAGSDLESSLLSLDTLNIEEAAGDAVPLTRLKNNTNSLVIILSWLEYLIKRVGIDESRNTLRYYTETLRWITPEVFFDLDKYLRGMKDKKDIEEGDTLSVRDHIVSLYFISKLNEKTLDEKLTKAVLQIIKQ
ncbi:MAG: hypothetical protein KC589_03960 [Nanoarchaeota archaeon]|nr:hypothetical protein [Nanoarchaeota archaeon]